MLSPGMGDKIPGVARQLAFEIPAHLIKTLSRWRVGAVTDTVCWFSSSAKMVTHRVLGAEDAGKEAADQLAVAAAAAAGRAPRQCGRRRTPRLQHITEQELSVLGQVPAMTLRAQYKFLVSWGRNLVSSGAPERRRCRTPRLRHYSFALPFAFRGHPASCLRRATSAAR